MQFYLLFGLVWGKKLPITIALVVVVFMFLYKESDEQVDDNDRPLKEPTNVNIYKQYNNCNFSERETEINVNKWAI
jgi:hypothetical protein